jgi:hypothetical protein
MTDVMEQIFLMTTKIEYGEQDKKKNKTIKMFTTIKNLAIYKL